MTLVEFLTARLDEDERAALAVQHWAGVRVESATEAEPAHIARHDPARVLADVAAKRSLISLLVHDHIDELRNEYDSVRGELFSEYVSSCTCGRWRHEHGDRPDFGFEHDRHREAVGYSEAVTTGGLQLLALPYAEHPDYREEWAP